MEDLSYVLVFLVINLISPDAQKCTLTLYDSKGVKNNEKVIFVKSADSWYNLEDAEKLRGFKVLPTSIILSSDGEQGTKDLTKRYDLAKIDWKKTTLIKPAKELAKTESNLDIKRKGKIISLYQKGKGMFADNPDFGYLEIVGE